MATKWAPSRSRPTRDDRRDRRNTGRGNSARCRARASATTFAWLDPGRKRIVRRPLSLASDPLAPIRRLSQAEKIALFS